MIRLYPYQREMLAKLTAAKRAGRRKVIVCLPTGTGKTIVAGKLLADAVKLNKQVLVLAHRMEIVRQFAETAKRAGLMDGSYGVISAGVQEQSWRHVQIAMVQTLVRRMETTQIKPDLIIVDECHHAVANSYLTILRSFPDAFLLGLSATPERPDGKGLNQVYEEILQGESMRWYIERGYLAPYAAFAPPTGISKEGLHVIGGDYKRSEMEAQVLKAGQVARLAENIMRFGKGRRWIAFGSTRNGSKTLEAELHRAGVRCRHLDGETPLWERDYILQSFADPEGDVEGLLTVDLIDEGFDCPDADCAFLYRPTKSHVKYLQSCGRVLRHREGKIARLVDLAGNMMEHGPPCMTRNWSLLGRADAARKSGKVENPFRLCRKCYAMTPASVRACQMCGHVPPPKPLPKERDVPITEIDIAGLTMEVQKNAKGGIKNLNRMARSVYKRGGPKAVFDLADKLGKSPGWAYHYTRARR